MIMAICIFPMFLIMCSNAHAEPSAELVDTNSQGLDDSDPGFIQDSCPANTITYRYDRHIRRVVIDCHPDPMRVQESEAYANWDYCTFEDPDRIVSDGLGSFCLALLTR
jgi:hypothetical protein